MAAAFELIAVTLPWPVEPSIALAASRAGGLGVLDLEYAPSTATARTALERLIDAGGGGRVGVKLSARSTDLLTMVGRLSTGTLDVILLVPGSTEETRDAVGRLKPASRRILLQVRSVEEAAAVESLPIDGLVAKGNDAGGWVASENTFVLLQRLLARARLPVWAQGGIGLHSAAACFAGGAAGVVLDFAFALSRESPLDEATRSALSRMDGSETACLGEELDLPYRVHARPGSASLVGLRAAEGRLARMSGPLAERQAAWQKEVSQRLALRSQADAAWPLGQDVAFAPSLARRYGTVAGILDAFRRSVAEHVRDAQRTQSLSEGAPLARSLGTRFPIVQGPMTRVSDVPGFAARVAEAGALPFLALALLKGHEVRSLLEQTRAALGPKPWGVGILGFVPEDVRAEQLEAMRAAPPPFALIAGGRPDQALSLEKEGIPTFLHVPSAALLRSFFEQGVRRFVFEGRECGGHVGPLSSFVLWDRAVDVLAELLPGSPAVEPCQVLLAGGIHDGRSGAMATVMGAPLAGRGVELGVLVGTAYLFTHEAAASGAIAAGFQEAAIRCGKTALLETGTGHVVRCAPTPYVDEFRAQRSRLIASQRSAEEVCDTLERLNLGRLRIAAKGVCHGDASSSPLSVEQQRAEGLYMMGQVASLRDGLCSMEELHHELSDGSLDRLRRLSVPAGIGPRRRPAEQPVDIAIIGMGCLFPQAGNPKAFWCNILDKVDAITEVPAERFNAELYFDPDPTVRGKTISKWGGFFGAIPFDPVHHGIPPTAVPSIEPAQLLVLEVVEAALKDAGYLDRPFSRERTSVVFGVTGWGDLLSRYALRTWSPVIGTNAVRPAGPLPEWTEDSLPGTITNIFAGRVASRFDLGGMNITVDAACATSLAALQVAARELAACSCDVVIAGAADAGQNPGSYLSFSALGAFSPDGRCRPFDHRANGIVISEGIAAVVLKRLEDAERDGDRVYAILKGIAASSDGRALGLTAPRPEGQMAALERAYCAAGISPDTVGLVEAHGTGTVAGDHAEVQALRTFFEREGAARESCAIGSVKSMIGHTKGAAGLAGVIKAALALHHKVLPATLHVERPDPRLRLEESPFYLNVESGPWLEPAGGHARRAGVSAFGFGGTNFHAVLEEAPDRLGESLPADAVAERWPAELLLIRASSSADLVRRVEQIERALENGAQPTLPELAKAASAEGGTVALAVVTSSLADAREKLALARRELMGCAVRLRDPRGVYFSTEPLLSKNGNKLALLFPGQGSQYVGMGRELAVHFSEVRRAFERANELLTGRLSRPLSTFVFPPPGFGDEVERAASEALMATDVAQPALGALSFGMFRLLQGLGLRPDMLGGHSYGELVALCAAGAFSEDVLYVLSHARGRCFADAVHGRASGGTMAAVEASPEVVAELTASLREVWIANRNGPRQTVLSGSDGGVRAALELLTSRGIGASVLPVACAFHSPLVAAAQARFDEALSAIAFATPGVQVFSNVAAAPYPDEAGAVATNLREQLLCPVDFAGQVRAMYQAGARLFVEVGPRDVLAGLVGQILEGQDAVAISMDAPGRSGLMQLLHVLALAAAEGAPVRVDRLLQGRVDRPMHLDQMNEVCAPQTLAPTTWLVDGGRARPAFGATPTSPGDEIDSPFGSSVKLGSDRPPVPDESMDLVIAQWQRSMHRFLEVQREVMLGYMQRQGGGAPVVEPPQPRPVVLAAPPTVEFPRSREQLLSLLQRLASEKTGYPVELLKPDLKLDAELGIASLKRLEILSGFAARVGLPAQVLRNATERLARLKTLGTLADAFLELLDSGPSEGAVSLDRSVSARKAFPERTTSLQRHLLGAVEAPPGEPNCPIAGTILITDDERGVARALADELRQAGAHPVLLRHRADPRDTCTDAIEVNLQDARGAADAVAEARRRHGPIGGLFHLLPLGNGTTAPIAMDWRGQIGPEVKGLYHLARASAHELGRAGTSFLVAATSGGLFGAGGGCDCDQAPAHGAIAGVVKALAREWTGTRCKVVDLESGSQPAAGARLLLREGRSNGVDVQLGYRGSRRLAMRPTPSELMPATSPPLIDSSSVLLVTGGASGITAQVVHELAARYRPTLWLVGRSPLPEDEPAETASIATPQALRAWLAERLRGERRAPPEEIERTYQRLLRERRIRASLAALSQTGATVRYVSADVRDEAKFGGLIDQLYATYGRIDGVIHGAAVIEDRLIEDKEPDSFDRVFDTKVLSAQVLARRLRPETLKFLVFFSSMAGSFGNRGQVDYVAANAFLDRLASYLDARWPSRVVSMAWGPWDIETGMMTEDVAHHFRARGVPLIPPSAGRQAADSELRRGKKGEVEVILGPLPDVW